MFRVVYTSPPPPPPPQTVLQKWVFIQRTHTQYNTRRTTPSQYMAAACGVVYGRGGAQLVSAFVSPPNKDPILQQTLIGRRVKTQGQPQAAPRRPLTPNP
eukprot:scaffold16485_cov65-Phaeocystis_antarctica.AAC.11